MPPPNVIAPIAILGGVVWLAVVEPWLLWGVAGVVLAGLAFWVWWINRSERGKPVERKPLPPTGMETGLYLGDYISNGDPWCPRLAWTHVVIGGIPDSGKSNLINKILVEIAPMPNVQILAIDPKGGVELGPWEERLAYLAESREQTLALLEALHREVSYRAGMLRRAKKRKLFAELGLPWLVLIIDETNEVLGSLDPVKPRRDKVRDLLASIMSMARFCGVSVILATQKPSANSIPTDTRDNAGLRVSFATTTREMTDVVLGSGSTTIGADAHRIKLPQGAGIACVWDAVANRFRWVKMRYVTDEMVQFTARLTAIHNRPWDLQEPLAKTARTNRSRQPRAVPNPRNGLADPGQTETEATG